MKIYLIKPLTAEDANLLHKIGVTVSGNDLDVPDTRKTYCKNSGCHYSIYCYDDVKPVATLFIKRSFWDLDQIVNVDKEQIEIAERELRVNSVDGPAAFLSYEERQRQVRVGDYSCLFETPFSELRFDEQDIVRRRSYQCEGSEQYHPLSQRGLEIVTLIRDTKKELDFIRQNGSSFFAGCEEMQRSYHETNRKIWNNLLTGSHVLTRGMEYEKIQAYFRIAESKKVPAGFQETVEAAIEPVRLSK